VRESSYCFSAT